LAKLKPTPSTNKIANERVDPNILKF
jgi:hypothetical protein